MSTESDNVNKEKSKDGDGLPETQDLEAQQEEFGSFQGFNTVHTEENLSQAVYPRALGGLFNSPQPSQNPTPSLTEERQHDPQASTLAEGPPTTAAGISDIKKKIPDLPDLILPSTPASPHQEVHADPIPSSPSTDSDDIEATSAEMPPLLRRISISAPARFKTRLQEPPPLTPAMKNQLTHCSSSLQRRRVSLLLTSEQQSTGPEDKVANKVSSEKANVLHPTPGVSGSFNKTSNTVAPPLPDEDKDPLDDDIIPASKKKKSEDSKWDIYLQWIFLLLVIAMLACSVKIRSLNRVKFLGLELWRWLALTLVVFCGRLISGWIMKLLEMLIEKHYILKKRVLYFVYGLRRSVKNSLWLALVLAVWETIFRGLEETKAVNILTKILWCLFTASVSWMVKVLAVKVAANSFHRKAYFDRIQECIFNQHLLEILSAPPKMTGIVDVGSCQDSYKKQSAHKKHKSYGGAAHKQSRTQTQKVQRPSAPLMQRSKRLSRQFSIEMPAYTTVEVGDLPACDPQTPSRLVTGQGPIIARSPIPIEQEKLQELTSDTVSVWTLRRLMKLIRSTNISTYSSMISQEKEEGEIGSEVQAKAAAKQIFYNMASPGQKSLVFKDFIFFLDEDQALRAFGLFEVTESGEITKKGLTKWVVGVYKERKALAFTLNDNRTVVAKLHNVLNVVLALTLFIVFFLICGVETSKLLVFFSSVFIPSVFVFGNCARTTFESLIFLFVTHPFDVGDRVVVDGVTMLVEVSSKTAHQPDSLSPSYAL